MILEKTMDYRFVNNKKIYGFENKYQLIDFILPQKKILIALGAEKVLKNDKRLTKIVNDNIAYCDGEGAVMALKKKGLFSVKIPGAKLWLYIISKCYKTKSFYLIGGKQKVIDETVNKLKTEFERINIINYSNGYFSDFEMEKIEQDIIKKKPDIIFVALGSPKQEYLMSSLIKKHPALYMGLGGSFDLYTGQVKDVPAIWKKIFKWEGIYRSFNDFRNIKRWRRQLIVFKFLYKLYFNKL